MWSYLPPQQTTFQVDLTPHHVLAYRDTEYLRQQQVLLMSRESF